MLMFSVSAHLGSVYISLKHEVILIDQRTDLTTF